jgi:hypothetical protein
MLDKNFFDGTPLQTMRRVRLENNVSYFVSVNRAYKSEIALYRQERVTAEYCAVIKAPEGTKEFYAVEVRPDTISIYTDMTQAFAAMVSQKATRLVTITVTG